MPAGRELWSPWEPDAVWVCWVISLGPLRTAEDPSQMHPSSLQAAAAFTSTVMKRVFS